MHATPRWLLPGVLALHAGFLLALARGDAPSPLALPVAMSIELLAPPAIVRAVAPAPRNVAPRPLAQPPRPVAPPIPAVAEPAPLRAAVAHPESTEPAPVAAPAATPTPIAAAPAAPVFAPTPPRFDAAYLNNPAPAYPPLARRMGEQGRVLLRVLVSTVGAADRIELKQGSGSPRLDDAALEAVRRWRFVPARQGGEAVAAWVLVPISFNLES